MDLELFVSFFFTWLHKADMQINLAEYSQSLLSFFF